MKKMAMAFALLCLLGTAAARGQEAVCDCYIGKIASFDFEGAPTEAYANEMEAARWRALVMAPGQFSVRVFENAGCYNFRKIDAAAQVAAWGDGTLRSGNSRNVAPPGPIKELEYLFSGAFAVDAGSSTITVQLETAYSREVVRSASVSFPRAQAGTPVEMLAATLAQVDTAVRELAKEFQPLGSRIIEYERKKRDSDPMVARTCQGGNLELNPERQKMTSDETLKVDLTLTDCDGVALGNREVRFSQGEWPEGTKIPGTTNGVVIPDPVTTDGEGKATVYFNPKGKGTAMVRAWYPHYRPSGHPKVLFDETAISVSQPPQYSVRVGITAYKYEDQELIQGSSDGRSVTSEQILHAADWQSWIYFFETPVSPVLAHRGYIHADEFGGQFRSSRLERRTQYDGPGELSSANVEKLEYNPRKVACADEVDAPLAPLVRECYNAQFNASLGGLQIPNLPIPLPPGIPIPEVPKQIVIAFPVTADLDRLAMTYTKSGGWKKEDNVATTGLFPNTFVIRAGDKGVTWEEKDGKITVTYKFKQVTEKPEVKYKLEEFVEVRVKIVQF